MRKIIIAVIFLWGMLACKSKYRKAADEIAANTPAPVNMNVGKDKYTLQVPDGWTTENRTMYGLDYYYLMAPKTTEDPNTNINVANEFMQNRTLEQYMAGITQSLKKAIPTAVVTGQGEIAANNVEGSWFSYNMEPQGIKASLVCYVFPKNGVAYIITAGTQRKDAAKYRRTFDNVARSFRFTGE